METLIPFRAKPKKRIGRGIMAQPGKPEQALLFLAVAYQKELGADWIAQNVLAPFGTVYRRSSPFLFSYSDYYEPEMGHPLVKEFVVYDGFFEVERAVAVKWQAMELEQQFSFSGRRRVNIDPGYLTLAKLVLTTTKNYDHRIYLGRGIYGDVQLRYRKGQFVFNPWTYPDYRDELNLEFLQEARQYLYQLVKSHEA